MDSNYFLGKIGFNPSKNTYPKPSLVISVLNKHNVTNTWSIASSKGSGGAGDEPASTEAFKGSQSPDNLFNNKLLRDFGQPKAALNPPPVRLIAGVQPTSEQIQNSQILSRKYLDDIAGFKQNSKGLPILPKIPDGVLMEDRDFIANYVEAVQSTYAKRAKYLTSVALGIRRSNKALKTRISEAKAKANAKEKLSVKGSIEESIILKDQSSALEAAIKDFKLQTFKECGLYDNTTVSYIMAQKEVGNKIASFLADKYIVDETIDMYCFYDGVVDIKQELRDNETPEND